MIKNQGFALKVIDDLQRPFAERLQLQEKDLPSLKSGQVLVKMIASPVNPSDLVYLMGQYGLPPVDGAYAGFEGCGQVIEANAGLYGKYLTGKRVALSATPGADGLWAKYAIVQANHCLPVHADLTDAQAATLIVNPCTSVCLVDRAKQLGAKAMVLNAAASQVGKGVIRYAKTQGIKTIATVRSRANVEALKQLRADCVLLTSADDFCEQLKHACKTLGASVFIDAVADTDTPRVLAQMPSGSTAIVYGRLTETVDPYGGYFSVADVIFKNQRIEGFWLATELTKANPLRVLALSKKVQKLFRDGIFATDIYGQFNVDQFVPALEHYAVHKSDGKVLLRFD
ncbi:zinc-binding dehydrogenase [Thalassotalea ponticola]|uniref:zinc-binding dehydrogenase n=1 Tax=Thalassotalea ponticola TaxID=1523392 RepID=UPI0025B56942|nr:zinc-binding dehydrogenase [Thalassotalea ponticola]MDN3652971.1 zinc-binding dehydrogenase [Thalassotalea ponticola]